MQNITEQEIALLKSCKSEQDWNNACDTIKKARKGAYPPDWWPKVKMSGLMDEILARFGRDSEIRIHSVKI